MIQQLALLRLHEVLTRQVEWYVIRQKHVRARYWGGLLSHRHVSCPRKLGPHTLLLLLLVSKVRRS